MKYRRKPTYSEVAGGPERTRLQANLPLTESLTDPAGLGGMVGLGLQANQMDYLRQLQEQARMTQAQAAAAQAGLSTAVANAAPQLFAPRTEIGAGPLRDPGATRTAQLPESTGTLAKPGFTLNEASRAARDYVQELTARVDPGPDPVEQDVLQKAFDEMEKELYRQTQEAKIAMEMAQRRAPTGLEGLIAGLTSDSEIELGRIQENIKTYERFKEQIDKLMRHPSFGSKTQEDIQHFFRMAEYVNEELRELRAQERNKLDPQSHLDRNKPLRTAAKAEAVSDPQERIAQLEQAKEEIGRIAQDRTFIDNATRDERNRLFDKLREVEAEITKMERIKELQRELEELKNAQERGGREGRYNKAELDKIMKEKIKVMQELEKLGAGRIEVEASSSSSGPQVRMKFVQGGKSK